MSLHIKYIQNEKRLRKGKQFNIFKRYDTNTQIYIFFRGQRHKRERNARREEVGVVVNMNTTIYTLMTGKCSAMPHCRY